MALVTERIEDNVLYLELNGRIDSSNAQQAEELINAIKESHPDLQRVLDAENLEYLSSAGLRVVLRMRKDTADLKIINVSNEVYEILEMTGFTDMITVKKPSAASLWKAVNSLPRVPTARSTATIRKPS